MGAMCRTVHIAIYRLYIFPWAPCSKMLVGHPPLLMSTCSKYMPCFVYCYFVKQTLLTLNTTCVLILNMLRLPPVYIYCFVTYRTENILLLTLSIHYELSARCILISFKTTGLSTGCTLCTSLLILPRVDHMGNYSL